MVKAVRYDEFGGIDVLRVDEAVIRTGTVAELFPSTFPSGQGSDSPGSSRRSAPGSAASPPVMR
jgi:hypothetical protein